MCHWPYKSASTKLEENKYDCVIIQVRISDNLRNKNATDMKENFREFYEIDLDISFKNDPKHKGINTSVDTPVSELTVFHRCPTESNINDAK